MKYLNLFTENLYVDCREFRLVTSQTTRYNYSHHIYRGLLQRKSVVINMYQL